MAEELNWNQDKIEQYVKDICELAANRELTYGEVFIALHSILDGVDEIIENLSETQQEEEA